MTRPPRGFSLRLVSVLLLMTMCVVGAAFGQRGDIYRRPDSSARCGCSGQIGGVPGAALGESANGSAVDVRRPNSSNFGRQDRLREAGDAQDKFRAELKPMTDDDWRAAALAMMEFESGADSLVFNEVVRISWAFGDKKAVTEKGEYYLENDPSWVVKFGKRRPKTLTLLLADRASTEVKCSASELLDHGKGLVGIFQNDSELMCIARGTGAG